jgi:hypothetical protein
LSGRGSAGGDSRAIRADLAARLRARAPAIRAAIFDRVRRVSEPVDDENPTYTAGLRGAIGSAVNSGLDTIENGLAPSPQVSELVLGQARRAAREGVRLDTVMRRYTAGTKVLEDFIVEEAADLPDAVLRQVLSELGDQVERIMDAASAAYRDEITRARRSVANRRADRIARLLGSETRVPPTDLDYDFDLWHVGIILRGGSAGPAGRRFAERLGFQSLHGEREEELAWTWLGSRRRPSIEDILRAAQEQIPAPTSVAIGEPRRGLEGWRLSHREAQVAVRVMCRKPARVVRGRDVVLLGAVLSDETLVRSLLDTYLAPIEELGRSEVVLDALRAFLAAGWNAAAASEELGVDRHTIRQRIKRVEKALGQPLDTCSAELQVALQIADLRTETPPEVGGSA